MRQETFTARTHGRTIQVDPDGTVTIRITWTASLVAPRRDRQGQTIPRTVQFPAAHVHAMKWRRPGLFFPGHLTITAPSCCGDRWSGRGDEQPHVFRFRAGEQEALLRVAWAIQDTHRARTRRVLAPKLPKQQLWAAAG